MDIVSKGKLKTLIEPYFHKKLYKNSYEVVSKKAIDLLTHTRFDLAFKLFYLDIKNKNERLAKEIYSEHIRAFSLGKFTEPGNEEKNSIESFMQEFEKIFEDIKKNGFDNTKTVIPLSENGSIANGAHRVASAIYLKTVANCVQLDIPTYMYNYKFFYKRNISVDILDMVATKFVEYAENIYIAFLWPTGQNTQKIQGVIPNIVYRKTIKLTPNGAHNLLSQIYYGEEWLGSIEDDFKGSKGKLLECFKTFDEFEVVAFQAKSLEEVLKIKDKIRDIFNVGKHSVHITDTIEEARRVVKVVFNENSIHFLNYSKPNKFLSTHLKIDKFKNFLTKNNLNSDDVIIDGSLILSCYGLREAKDIDFYCYDNNKIKYNFKDINTHDEELKYYKMAKEDLIYNPKNYFYFNDLKFISFTQLYKMKENRAELKDINDCQMMEALIENNKIKEMISRANQKFLYLRIKIRSRLIDLLKIIRLYTILKKIVKR